MWYWLVIRLSGYFAGCLRFLFSCLTRELVYVLGVDILFTTVVSLELERTAG